MAYTDDYVKTNWVNYPSTNTPLNQTNLNHAEGGIKTNCGRIANLDTTKANQSDLLLTVKNVSFDSTTGTFTFTLWNNATITVNTDIEKVAVNFTYDDDPASPHYQNLVLELSDGTYKYIDMSALITQYEFTNTSTIAFTVGVGGEITANVVDGSITANKLQPNYLADCQAAQTGAQNAKAAADADALKSEGFANGTQNGTPVTSGSPYYENNAKYWKEQAQAIASQSLAGLTDVDINAPADGDIITYDSGDNKWTNEHTSYATVTNNPISITTQSTQVARYTKITLNPIQASGTPTPANPLPISGYDNVDLQACGVNQWDEQTVVGALLSNGTIDVSVTTRLTTSFIPVVGGQTYYQACPDTALRGRGAFYDQNQNILSYLPDWIATKEFTAPAGAKYLRVTFRVDYGTTYNHDVSFNYPATDTTYHAYTPATLITHSFPTTIYGGEVDVERGVLKVTQGIVDLGDLRWYYSDTLSLFYAPVSDKAIGVSNAICSCCALSTLSALDMPNNTFKGDATNNIVNVKNFDYTDTNAFKTAVTGQKLVYELATPYEIPLTPRLVNLLQGAYVVTSNGTSIEITYRNGTIATLADVGNLNRTIDVLATATAGNKANIATLDGTKADLSAIAPIENGATASQAYKVNEYFIRGGKLCKCISAISAGSAFTLNTNYKETTLANEIPKITVGNTDLTDGVSPLASGQFYIYIPD